MDLNYKGTRVTFMVKAFSLIPYISGDAWIIARKPGRNFLFNDIIDKMMSQVWDSDFKKFFERIQVNESEQEIICIENQYLPSIDQSTLMYVPSHFEIQWLIEKGLSKAHQYGWCQVNIPMAPGAAILSPTFENIERVLMGIRYFAENPHSNMSISVVIPTLPEMLVTEAFFWAASCIILR